MTVLRNLLLWFLASLTLASISTGSPMPTTGSASATFVRQDTTTQGTWKGTYGADGYSIANNTQSIPGYATFAVQNQGNYTWAASTSDPRALQSASGTGRIASTWDGVPAFNFDVNFTDGNTHQLAIYALDWDSYSGIRAETVQILDAATGALIDSRALPNFVNGTYLVWNISGHVTINVMLNSGGNAVVSGVFFGSGVASNAANTPASLPGSSAASFVTSDTATEGSWIGKYGSDGYSMANASQSIPSYATVSVQNQLNYTWASGTSDPRALETGSGSGRIAATWFSNSNFDFDVNLTDGKPHQVALYALDWDDLYGGRAEEVQIADAGSGAVLDTRIISGFTNGIYLIWNVTGHVKITVTLTGNGNAVISGIFFGSATAPGTSGGTTAPTTVSATEPVSVSVAPSIAALAQGQAQAFSATVQNSTNTSVTWTISPNVGTISSTGVYTAPATIAAAQIVSVTATSAAAPATAFASATVTLAPSQTPAPASSTSLPSGLALHWTFDTASISGTTVTDTSNNGGTGTMYGNPAVVTGKLGQALSFNGVNSLVSMYAYGDPLTEFNNSITLSAWINTTNSSRTEAIISKYSAAGSGDGYVFRTDAAGHVELMVGSGDLSAYPATVTDTSIVNNGQWHHVAAVITMGQNVQFYVDGKLSSTAAMYTLANGDAWSNLEVGSSSYAPYGNYFTGSIDEVQVYDRALAAAEVSTVYTLTGGTQTQASSTPPTTTTTPPVTPQGQLSVGPTSFNFGTVLIGSSVTESFTVSNSGSGSLTISNVSLAGPGLAATGVSAGTTLAAGQSTTLTVTFTPAAAGTSTGSVTFTSNAADASLALGLTGTGAQPAPVVHSVILSWAPSASPTAMGYDVYRGTTAGGPYTLLNSTPVSGTTFTDTTGVVGQTYYYAVTTLDSSGVQSGYSNVVSATIP